MEGTGLIINPSSTNQTVSGTPLNYPNPFKPSTQSTTVSYTLAVDGTTSLYIFDMQAKLIWKRDYASGSMGGKAGYNEVTWDGRDDFSTQVGNGIYPFRIVSNGKVIGKGKIAVIE
jgi:flagellar hook assembly protein FlgD